MTEKLNVSIVIRTRDIEFLLEELLKRMAKQTLQPIEFVIVDNFSSKKKLDEMRRFLYRVKKKVFHNKNNFKLVPLLDEEFSYPYSANIGVAVACGSLVCITNGHSLPFSEEWLESGVAHFQNQKVAGVAGYFVPHKNGSLWEKLTYNSWCKLYEKSRAYIKDNYFSTVNCIFRKSLWKVYPFDEQLPKTIPFADKFGGEDYDWALEMLARGYEIVVEPKFNVYHSHKEPLSKLFSKHLAWQKVRKKIGSLTRPRKSYTKLANIKPLYYEI